MQTDPIVNHPEYIRAKERLISLGLKWEWLTHTIDTENPHTQFLPAGKRESKSDCPCYQGRWRLGGFGAVKCGAVQEPLPGAYYDLICGSRHETCPYRVSEKR